MILHFLSTKDAVADLELYCIMQILKGTYDYRLYFSNRHLVGELTLYVAYGIDDGCRSTCEIALNYQGTPVYAKSSK